MTTKEIPLSSLLGKTLVKIHPCVISGYAYSLYQHTNERLEVKVYATETVNCNTAELFMEFSDGTFVLFFHNKDCCEHVSIEEVIGDLSDLIGHPLLTCEERTEENPPEDKYSDTGTWTFYEFATIMGSVTVRWLGTSNGYYSEAVDWVIFDKKDHNVIYV